MFTRRNFLMSALSTVAGLLGLQLARKQLACCAAVPYKWTVTITPEPEKPKVGDLVKVTRLCWRCDTGKVIETYFEELGTVVWISPEGLYGVRQPYHAFFHVDGEATAPLLTNNHTYKDYQVPREIYNEGNFSLYEAKDVRLHDCPDKKRIAWEIRHCHYHSWRGEYPPQPEE